MAYLGDPRENRIGPNGELWEMDNRVEKRYYWNGQYMDLCGMEPEEAMKRVFNVKIVEDDADKELNNTKLSIAKGEDGSYNIKATMDKPVASDITIVANYEVIDEKGDKITGKTVLTIIKGNTEAESKLEGVDSISSINATVNVGPNESGATSKIYTDNDYNYIVNDFSHKEEKKIALYWGLYPYMNDLATISVNDLTGSAKQVSYVDFPVNDMVIPIADKEFDSLEEMINASYRIVFALPEEYVDRISIKDMSINSEIRDTFDLIEHSENGIRFLVHTGDNTELAPREEEIPLTYLITIK